MAFRLSMLCIALLFSAPARATLVVLAPSADGLVIAADSRIAFMGVQCDGPQKIVELARPARTVVIVTGDSVFVPPLPAGERNPCHYLPSAPRLLDVGKVVSDYVERSAFGPAHFSLEALGEECAAALRRFAEAHPGALLAYAGREIFSVVVAGYDPVQKTATIRNFVVRMEVVSHRIEAARYTTTTVKASDKGGLWIYGEKDYVDRNVAAGFGRKYLSASTLELFQNPAPVAEISRGQAVRAAVNAIDAASRTTEAVPAPSGIGGPVDVILLGRNPRPKVLSPATR